MSIFNPDDKFLAQDQWTIVDVESQNMGSSRLFWIHAEKFFNNLPLDNWIQAMLEYISGSAKTNSKPRIKYQNDKYIKIEFTEIVKLNSVIYRKYVSILFKNKEL